MKLANKTLFTTIGGPGSGKSHFTKRLAEEISAIRLNNDAMRHALFDEPTLPKNMHNYRLIYGAIDYAAQVSLQAGASVIYDANVNQQALRKKNADLAAQEGADAIVLWIQTPFEVRVSRVTSRELTAEQFRLTEDIVRGHDNRLEEPDETEKVIVIDGTADSDEQMEQFWEQIAKLQQQSR